MSTVLFRAHLKLILLPLDEYLGVNLIDFRVKTLLNLKQIIEEYMALEQINILSFKPAVQQEPEHDHFYNNNNFSLMLKYMISKCIVAA